MRKRSKYRPKGVLVDPMGFVMENLTPVAKHESYLIDLKIKNHGAMASLTQGKATRQDVDTLIGMGNIVEALYRLGFGTEYKDVVKAGLDAIHTFASRGKEADRFILRAQEMSALNSLMELHDAQMEVINLKNMAQAAQIVREEYRQKKARLIGVS